MRYISFFIMKKDQKRVKKIEIKRYYIGLNCNFIGVIKLQLRGIQALQELP